MRTHFLKNLQIAGRDAALDVVPKLDFISLRRDKGLVVKAEDDASSATLTLTAEYVDQAAGRKATITIRFDGVRYIKLPELNPSLCLSELEIDDVRGHGLEAVRYRMKDYMNGLEVHAAD